MIIETMNSKNLIKILITLAVSIHLSVSQGVKNCKVRPSTEPGQEDVHCSCMEQLIEWKNPIYKLTVNQTGCNVNVLRLDWTTLQTYVDVKLVIFEEATVEFKVNKENSYMNCSVVEMTFYNSHFKVIPSDAFYGLNKMKTLRILGGTIEEISSKAFFGFHLLKTIEFANVSIGSIKPNSFQELPLIEDLAFVRCRIGSLDANAISIMVPPKLPTVKCPTVLTRSRTATDNFVTDLMGRSLESVHDIQLPEYGARLFFFSCEMELVETGSIMTNVFPYIILAGNKVKHWKSLAVESRIQNECDIGAFLLIHNDFSNVGPRAFIGITGSRQQSYNTIMAVIKNNFNHVSENGFLINKDLNIPYIHGNKFDCKCPNLRWAALSRSKSAIQNVLETNLLNTSSCLGEEGPLSDFIQQCPEVAITDSGFDNNVPPFTVTSDSPVKEFHRDTEINGGATPNAQNYFIALHFLLAFVASCLFLK